MLVKVIAKVQGVEISLPQFSNTRQYNANNSQVFQHFPQFYKGKRNKKRAAPTLRQPLKIILLCELLVAERRCIGIGDTSVCFGS